MCMTDQIADMLTRIRNATRVRHPSTLVPSSKFKLGILEVLKREGYIAGFEIVENSPINDIRVHLKYGPEGEQVIQVLRSVSTPGRRVYSKASDVPTVKGGLGISVISTSKGVLSDRECRKHNVGGEVLATVF